MKKQTNYTPIFLLLLGAGAVYFLSKDKGVSTDTKKSQLLAQKMSDETEQKFWSDTVNSMTNDEIETVFEYLFFYIPIDKQVVPGSELSQKLNAISIKYNIFT